MTDTTATGPLLGLKVIEICTTIAGPACARLLADMGAEVIKIEPPEGDPVRQMGQHYQGESLYAASILRNKRSIVLDLKTPEGRQVAADLIAQADILVENNRPGVLERLNLGYDTLSARNPGLVMVRISGYGQTGPYHERPGYGAICEAVAGVRHMTGDPDRPPARVALATTDYLSSVHAAFGAVAAIHARQRTGKGQVVDVALYEAAYTQMEPVVPAYEKLGVIPQREGSNLPSMAPNSSYPTRDGAWVLIAANSQPTWRRLVALMQQPELLTDPRFETIQARGLPDNMRAIDAIVAAWTRGFDAADLEDLLRQGELPCTRVYTIADIYADPHFQERDMLVQVAHPVLGHTTQTGIVPRFSATPGNIRHTGPNLGADTSSVLSQTLGLSAGRIAELNQSGAVHLPT
ncbi:MAG: CoA transferase [Rhodoferax sp.]|jgi:crotonobetainyl-CoA:carnitine CoA-transferase CaiB-like acyl-CoA transferase|nr:CoA transferase [Rhodoferax sp.]